MMSHCVVSETTVTDHLAKAKTSDLEGDELLVALMAAQSSLWSARKHHYVLDTLTTENELKQAQDACSAISERI